MAKVSVVNIDIDDAWLEREKGEQAVHDTVVAYQAGLRAGTASTKNRSAVRGGGKKPWRQKGTGRARAGSIRSPIWRGGGVIFGPTPRSYAKKINKKVRTLALRRAFAERVDAGDVIVVDSFDFDTPKTKDVAAALDAIGAGDNVLVLVSSQADVPNTVLGARNLPRVTLMDADQVNVYYTLLHKKIVIAQDALESLGGKLQPTTKAVSE
jgi:large subunit ribosomal protein L4